MEAPRILAYRPATAVAEKFQAMIEIGLATSRMKDYHDIWMLSRTLEFEGQDLADAMCAIFQRRDTELPHEIPAELTREYTGQPETSQAQSGFEFPWGHHKTSGPAAIAARGSVLHSATCTGATNTFVFLGLHTRGVRLGLRERLSRSPGCGRTTAAAGQSPHAEID